MQSEASRKKADEMAEYLLTNGAGKKAVRLMLLGADEEDFGGWGPGPLTEMFAAALDEARAEGEKQRAEHDEVLAGVIAKTRAEALKEGAERERWECCESAARFGRIYGCNCHEHIAARGRMRGPEEEAMNG